VNEMFNDTFWSAFAGGFTAMASFMLVVVYVAPMVTALVKRGRK